jgi:hypothetical protein
MKGNDVARTLLLATAGVAALAPSVSMAAQVEGQKPAVLLSAAARTTSYDAAFFAQYAPRTALDIAQRVPGFNLDLGNEDVRGFAAAAGNVVINGARPSSKAESLQTTLSRIPASRVSKVENGPGDLYGADYSSKSQVLNIILSAEGGLDGNVTGSVRRLYDGTLVPNGSASVLLRKGPSSINVAAGFGNNFNAEEGTDRVTDFATGELLEFRRKHNTYHDFNPYLSASWALERASDKAIRVNARWSPAQFDLLQRNRVTPTGGTPHDDNLIQDYDNPVFELGGDVTRPLAGGAIKLVGLATRRKRNNFDAYIGRDALLPRGVQVGGFEQSQIARRNETLGRLTWTRADIAGFSVEAGGEAVLNTLDNSTRLFTLGQNGTRTPVQLPVANVRVKETRGEGFVNLGRQLNPALRVDGGVRYEFSHLTVTGDASADRKLMFWKPSLTLDWKPGGGWHTKASIERTVAHLSFYDFVTAAELSTNRVNAGNENLQPQRAWEFRVSADRPLFKSGLIKFDLGYDLVSKLQDRILIFDPVSGDYFDAPGNLGTGRHAFAQLTVDAPLDQLWKGLRVRVNGTVRRTRVTDPISGRKRNFSDFFPDWEWGIDVRRDAGAFSYGFTLQDRDRFTFFRTTEFDSNFNGGPFGTAFIEYRPSARTSITLDVDNALNTTGNRNRLLFYPNRAVPTFVANEFRERNRHVNVGLTLKQTFGGGGSTKLASKK